MLGWKRKPNGFQWHRYVQTTILMRREARRERVDNAMRAAREQAHAAGKAAKVGAVVGVRSAGHALIALGMGLVAFARTPGVAFALAIAGIVALVPALAQAMLGTPLSEVILPGAIGIALLAMTVPSLVRYDWRSLRRPSPVHLASFVTAILLSGGIGWLATGGSTPSLPTLSSLALTPAAKPLEGRAIAVAGDTLRFGATTIRLAGIEAPEREQRCVRGNNRKWRCAEAAQAALEKLTRGKTITCELGARDEQGRQLATCSVEQRDLAAALVREGHVFATGNFLSRYGRLESEARSAKSGVWIAGDATERASAYRSKVWEEARRTAPDGCPIKGAVSGSTKVYLLPWTSDYSSTRIRPQRGERWFCSERDAVAAGWRAADRS
jgi:endonuclease YncB( thermonuclease family)